MRKFIIIFGSISTLLIALVYITTLIQQSTKRNNQLFNEIMREVVETRDFEDFTKYQSLYYKSIDHYETSMYSISIYDVVSDKQDALMREWFIMVLPKDGAKYASTIKDVDDKTQAIITDVSTGQSLLNTKTDLNYEGYAMSYGISIYGFYYYALEINQSLSMRIELYDYDGEEIIADEKMIVEMDRILVNPPEGYLLGYTSEEINVMLDLDKYVLIPLIINMSIFLVIDISAGYFIYRGLKKRNRITS